MKQTITAMMAAAILCGTVATGTVVVVPLNTTASSVKVTYCLSSRCSNDTSPLKGSVTIDLDSIDNPTQATLLDFVSNATEPIDLFIQLGPGSTLTATGTNLVFLSATPGVPNGPVPIISGNATFTNVLAAMQGMLNYTASGLVCTLLSGQGYACNDVIDLSTLNPANADQVTMAISSVNRTVSISTHIAVTTPVDPNNPALGDVSVDATLAGSILVPLPPCPADLNSDRTINLPDLAILLSNYGVPNATPAQGDLNGDHVVDLADLATMLSQYGAPCPT